MGRRNIIEKIQQGQFQFTQHAYQQMLARDIYIRQVPEAIQRGRVVKRWNERDGEKLAIVGPRFNGDYIKVLVKDAETPRIITVCYPYEEV